MIFAEAIHGSAKFLAKTKLIHAQDQFLVGLFARHSNEWGHIICQLQPHTLSLFHLIIFINTVHDYDPMYSLLKRQCYWFENTIYHVVAHSYNCIIVQARENLETKQICIPPNKYLLDLAEWWRGVKVSRVSKTIL